MYLLVTKESPLTQRRRSASNNITPPKVAIANPL